MGVSACRRRVCGKECVPLSRSQAHGEGKAGRIPYGVGVSLRDEVKTGFQMAKLQLQPLRDAPSAASKTSSKHYFLLESAGKLLSRL
jgi:hypothetical protein